MLAKAHAGSVGDALEEIESNDAGAVVGAAHRGTANQIDLVGNGVVGDPVPLIEHILGVGAALGFVDQAQADHFEQGRGGVALAPAYVVIAGSHDRLRQHAEQVDALLVATLLQHLADDHGDVLHGATTGATAQERDNVRLNLADMALVLAGAQAFDGDEGRFEGLQNLLVIKGRRHMPIVANTSRAVGEILGRLGGDVGLHVVHRLCGEVDARGNADAQVELLEDAFVLFTEGHQFAWRVVGVNIDHRHTPVIARWQGQHLATKFQRGPGRRAAQQDHQRRCIDARLCRNMLLLAHRLLGVTVVAAGRRRLVHHSAASPGLFLFSLCAGLHTSHAERYSLLLLSTDDYMTSLYVRPPLLAPPRDAPRAVARRLSRERSTRRASAWAAVFSRAPATVRSAPRPCPTKVYVSARGSSCGLPAGLNVRLFTGRKRSPSGLPVLSNQRLAYGPTPRASTPPA